MSMLAERKRKQKWSLNPRGKEWSQDANKFGQKLLEKMGWQHGKGLGAKENGITEHVKVSYKNDSKGMGYKETNDQWTEHESNFSALLQSLTGGGSGEEEIKVSSLEQKSQISRARVHYHKFTRGKDLSRASEKDLANIFGKKSLKVTKKPKVPVKKEDPDSKESENISGFLINAGSMRDYFRKKIPNFGKVNGYVVGNNGVLKKEELESESELRSSFGFGFNSTKECSLTMLNKNNSESESEIRPSFGFMNEGDTPSKKSKSKLVSYPDKNNIDGKRKADEKDDTILSPKKKSKKEKAKTEENLGVSNPAFNPMSTPIKVQKHILDPIEESLTEETEDTLNVPKSKKKNKICVNKGISIEESITDSAKKKKISKNELNNPNFNEETENSIEEISIVSNPYEISTNKLKKTKKKKIELKGSEENTSKKEKRKNKSIEIENPSFEEKNVSQIEENSFEISSSKSKKKKKTLEIDNPNFDISEDNSRNVSQIVENPYEVKPKKNKKQKKLELDNPNFDETENSVVDISQLEENPYEVKPKKNKKQKKIEVFNPNFNETEDSITDTSQLEENPYEVKPNQKKKKNKHLAIDNPSFSEQEEKPIDSINPFEVKSKKIKKKEVSDTGIANPALDLKDSNNDDAILEDCDLILNVVSTPTIPELSTNSTNTTKSLGTVTKIENLRNRKSVRFSDITQELIIPNNEELKEMYKKDKSKKKKKGLDNLNFDKQQNNLDENVNTISKTLDNYQAEIENDMNEEKMKTVTVEDLMVGEVGNPNGEHEKLPDGTKLKFKKANLDGKTAFYQLDKVGPKKSYKHLIKGDILVKFKNTNLHEIRGYGVNNKA